MSVYNYFLTNPFGPGVRTIEWIYLNRTGGTILDLDGEPTYSEEDDGTNLRIVALNNTTAEIWQLIASNHPNDPANGWVRPLDYGISLNEKVWKRLSCFGTGGGGGGGNVIVSVDRLYVGTHARFTALVDGVELELLNDGTSLWQPEAIWTQGSTTQPPVRIAVNVDQIYIGSRARFDALPNGQLLELSDVMETWVTELEWRIGATSDPVPINKVVTCDQLYIGISARFTSLSNGLMLETRSGDNVWHEELEWTR